VDNIFQSIFRLGAIAAEQTGGASICFRWATRWAVSRQIYPSLSFRLNHKLNQRENGNS